LSGLKVKSGSDLYAGNIVSEDIPGDEKKDAKKDERVKV
jgi:hypothetical protein